MITVLVAGWRTIGAGMADAATLRARIAALESAFERQELSVEYDGRKVTYSSFDQIEKQIGYFRAQLRVAAGTGARQFRAVSGKGL